MLATVAWACALPCSMKSRRRVGDDRHACAWHQAAISKAKEGANGESWNWFAAIGAAADSGNDASSFELPHVEI